MNQHKSNLIRGCIFAILSLLLLCFIFSNSAQPREESAAQSMSIVSILKPLLDPHDRIPEDVFHNAVRKAAHFAEFAALGFSLAGLSDCLPWKRKKQRLAMPLLDSKRSAICSEGAQRKEVNITTEADAVSVRFCYVYSPANPCSLSK